MKIAQIAPLSESVPPKLYGGTERIVSYLTEELVRQGHEVTLFASGDSRTAARLVPCSRRALRLDPTVRDPLPHHVLMLEQVRQRADDFDILHFHSDYLHFPVFRDSADRTLTTLHGRLDLPDLMPFYRTFKDIPLVSISHSQRRPMPPVRWAGTIYHGLPRTLYRAHPEPGQYLAFLGRLSPEKQPDHAIEIAKRAGLPLKIAAKVDKVDLEYFKAKIEPLLDHPLIEFIGEIGERDKNTFLGEAMALVFPIGWPEPFGLVMIEAMACGTPVIGYRAGSAPEVLDDGVSGFIVEDIETAVAAIGRLSDLDRRRVRERFETRFSVERMAQDYLTLYRVPLDRAALDRAVLSSVLRDSTRHDQVALDGPVLDAVPLEGGASDSPALDRVGPPVGRVSLPPQSASGQTCRVSAPRSQRARTERPLGQKLTSTRTGDNRLCANGRLRTAQAEQGVSMAHDSQVLVADLPPNAGRGWTPSQIG